METKDQIESLNRASEERSLSFSSERAFSEVSREKQINAYLCLMLIFLAGLVFWVPYPILIDYFKQIDLSEGATAEILSYTFVSAIAGNILQNFLLSLGFKYIMVYCCLGNAMSSIILIYGACNRSYWILVISRIVLGLSVPRVPASRYIFCYLPKPLLNKFSFLLIAALLSGSGAGPLVDLLAGLAVPSSTVSANMLDLNKYSTAFYGAAACSLLGMLAIIFFFSDKTEPEKQESLLSHDDSPPVNIPLLGLILLCCFLYEGALMIYSLVFPYFNKTIPADSLSEGTINALVSVSNVFALAIIVLFKKNLDRALRSSALTLLCCFSGVIAVLMTSLVTQNIIVYYSLFTLQLTLIYLIQSLLYGTLSELFSIFNLKGFLNAGFLGGLMGGAGRSLGTLLFKLKDAFGSATALIDFFGILLLFFTVSTCLIIYFYRSKINISK